MTSAATGPRPTKPCGGCREDKLLADFPLDRNTASGRQSYCFDCRADRNALRSLADRIAGGRKARFALPPEERAEIYDTARRMHDLGADFGRAQSAETIEHRGFVYVIDHPLMYGVKVGRAFDPESRLRSYQTGCPRRSYRLRYASFFEDCHTAEKAIHARLNPHQLVGEWFAISPDEGQECIEAFARMEKYL